MSDNPDRPPLQPVSQVLDLNNLDPALLTQAAAAATALRDQQTRDADANAKKTSDSSKAKWSHAEERCMADLRLHEVDLKRQAAKDPGKKPGVMQYHSVSHSLVSAVVATDNDVAM